MDTRKFANFITVAALLVLAGCAPSPLEESKRKAMEADIDDILSQELDPAEVGEPRTCLSENEYRSFRALGNRHLLFQGRQGKQWVNFLRGRCPNLRDNSVFIIEPHLAGRLCDADRFNVVDRLDPVGGTGSTCILGEFRPVTEAQVKEIEARLEMR